MSPIYGKVIKNKTKTEDIVSTCESLDNAKEGK